MSSQTLTDSSSSKSDTKSNSSSISGIVVIKLILLFTFLKALALPLLLKLYRDFLQMDYSNPHCVLRLVNETNADHYETHIHWRDVNYNESLCPDLQGFVDQQYGDLSRREFNLFKLFFILPLMIGIAINIPYLYNFYNDIYGAIKNLIMLRMFYKSAGQIFLLITHFEQDLLFKLGNIHHANIERFTEENNLTLVGTVPQGLLFAWVCNVLWLHGVIYYSLKYISPKRKTTIMEVSSQLSLGLFNIIYQMKYNHQLYHETAVPEWENALPFTSKYMAYHHVLVHHVNGKSLGVVILWDVVFDRIADAYSAMYKYFQIDLGSWEDTLLSVSFDIIQLLAALMLLMLTYKVLEYFLIQAEKLLGYQAQKEVKDTEVKKTNNKQEIPSH